MTFIKKQLSCDKNCINNLERLSKCIDCEKNLQILGYFLLSLLIVIILVGAYWQNTVVSLFGFIAILLYKLFSYQIERLFYSLVVKKLSKDKNQTN